jgi:NitT/TauT family transport system permease protein
MQAALDEPAAVPAAGLPARSRAGRITRLGRSAVQAWPAAAAAALIIVLWSAAVSVFDIDAYVLPAPLDVVTAAFDPAQQWPRHIWITTQEILGGFVLAAVSGIALGIAIAWSSWARRALVPLLVFTNTLPKVALAPLFLVWVGYGVLPNILIAAMIAFFPIVINTAVGLVEIDQDVVDLGRSLQAPKRRIFRKLRLPNALPYILSSLKVGITLAVIGAIIGEFVAAQAGLGYVITAVQTSLSTDVALAAMFWISVIGLVLYGLVDLLGRLFAPWASRDTRT